MSLSVLDCNYIYARMLWGIILQGILAQKESYYFSCHLSLLYIWIKMDSLILSINGYGDNRAWWAKDGLASKPFLEDKDYTMEASNGLTHEFLHSCFFGG